MAKTSKNEKTPLLIKLYTSPKFWAGLLLLFFLTFFIIYLSRGVDLGSSFFYALLTFALMPLFLIYISQYSHIGFIGSNFMFLSPIIWLLEIGTILWMNIQALKLKKRAIIIIGSAVLLLLVTQFVGCAIRIFNSPGL